MMGAVRIAIVSIGAVVVSATACAPRQFDRELAAQRWSDAARTFSTDSALLHDERAVYLAGILYGTPSRPTYDPDRARGLFRRLLFQFPNTRYRADATDRLADMDALLRARDSNTALRRELESKIAARTAEVQQLRAILDSTTARADLLRRNTARLESDLRDHDEQLRALRLELQRLKEIDLKPRPPSRRPP